MTTFFHDVRYGVRLLRKSPAFTTVTILVLTLAIGGTAAMFSIINALVLRPLAVKEPDRLVRFYNREKKPQASYRSFSYPNYVEIRDKNTVFTDVMAFTLAMAGANEGEMTRRTFIGIVSANYFSTFGIRMAAGRGFLPEEERPGSATPVA